VPEPNTGDRNSHGFRVPTIAEEDAKRPNRERDCLVGERTRIVNRIKSTLARLGICNFKPSLRKAADRLATVHTPEGMPLPPNTLAELQSDMARLGFVVSQIREIEEARQKRLEQHETGPHAMVPVAVRGANLRPRSRSASVIDRLRKKSEPIGKSSSAHPW
jgi:transposase